MPVFGLGVFKVQEGPEVERAVLQALKAGYRSIDTASVYGNEAGVGRALKSADEEGIPRKEIFVTTKLWNSDARSSDVEGAFQRSLEMLGLDYVDLYLLYWPVETRIQVWKELENLYKSKRTRAIGVSNFTIDHLTELLANTEIVPVVNQVEFHPRLYQKDLLDFCREREIVIEAWSPLMRGRCLDEAVFIGLAKKYVKTPAQIILRWEIQHGIITIPKSVTPSRIEENTGIFDFTLYGSSLTPLAS